MQKHTNIYFHNYGNFIIINRPKYGSRVLNLYWDAHIKKIFKNNIHLKRINELAFLNQFVLTESSEPKNLLLHGHRNSLETFEEKEGHFYFKDEVIEHFQNTKDGEYLPHKLDWQSNPSYHEGRLSLNKYLIQLQTENNILLNKIWKGKQINIPVYVVYRNPENHFKSGLLQDVGYHSFLNDKQKLFEMFDSELSDSGYTGNHRGNYLSMIMPHLYHLKQLNFLNLDSNTSIDFYNIFKYESDDYLYYKKYIDKTGMNEKEHRNQSSHKPAYDVVNEYFNQENVNHVYHNHYFSDMVWYNKIKNDVRNII